MTENMTCAIEMHSDHRHWNSELAMWKEDITNWRSEHAIALDLLLQAKTMITSHEACLDAHQEKMSEVSKAIQCHEKTLAASLRGGAESDRNNVLNDKHESHLQTMITQHDAHERIKKHHHTAMAKVELLLKALEAPM